MVRFDPQLISHNRKKRTAEGGNIDRHFQDYVRRVRRWVLPMGVLSPTAATPLSATALRRWQRRLVICRQENRDRNEFVCGRRTTKPRSLWNENKRRRRRRIRTEDMKVGVSWSSSHLKWTAGRPAGAGLPVRQLGGTALPSHCTGCQAKSREWWHKRIWQNCPGTAAIV